ncbi:MAG: CDP-diacylglycerol--serine O-phosphatidyltransferase [Candidatus Palauibacterales bacterium]|nr:CDP-diacylglycerol--serine O-phosphatidyltransferase [Candidatus Palauibacterales bacterium]MDP2582907.1 CDP-diacylglycerol--serine O-phosphatidyltransferase [Candidatus Palauibacterales bacterium]
MLVLPSAFTLGNLFFGFWSVISSFRGRFDLAAWLVMLAAVFDWLDGRVAHLSAGDSAFGGELDSLVDLVSFGMAPAILTYAAFLREEWSWLMCGAFVGAMAVRLARFNVEQAGGAKRYFLGLPSPAAGAFLAMLYPFSTTALFQRWLAGWPWATIVPVSVVALAVLMVSHVPYAALRPGLRGRRARLGLAGLVAALVLVAVAPEETLFPILAFYVMFGFARALGMGLVDRLAGRAEVEAELSGSDGEVEA